MSIIEDIKSMAHSISEGYLIFDKDVNSSISSKYEDGTIANKEILKRVCELVNQNIYLSLFNDSTIDKSNIEFNFANYEELLSDFDDMESGMEDYDFDPSNFKDSLMDIVSEKTASQNVDTLYIHKLAEEKAQMDNFIGVLESAKESFSKMAEESYIKMKRDAKEFIGNGESLGDMSKISSEYTQSLGFNGERIKLAYDIMATEISSNGTVVPMEITKVASESFDFSDELFTPVENLATSISSIESVDEIIEKVASIRDILKTRISNGNA